MSMIKQTETIDEDKIQFLLTMAHFVAGGYPAIGIQQGVEVPDYVVAPTCSCDECRSYLKATPPKPDKSVIDAIRKYIETRIQWGTLHEATKQTRH